LWIAEIERTPQRRAIEESVGAWFPAAANSRSASRICF